MMQHTSLLICIIFCIILPAAHARLLTSDETGAGASFRPKLGGSSRWLYQAVHRPNLMYSSRFWNEGLLREGVVVSGHNQLHGLLNKLHSGKPITVAAFGTSISDNGGCFHRSVKHLAGAVGMLRWSEEEAEKKCSSTQAGYLNNFMTVINSTFPHPDHLLVNNAVPGYTPGSYANGFCWEFYIPRRPDLMILEQLVNLLQPVNELERFLHRMRTAWGYLPPTILTLNMRTHTDDATGGRPSCVTGDPTRCNEQHCQELYKVFPPLRAYSEQPGEEATHMAAGYYGFSSLSVRSLYNAWAREGLLERLNMSSCQMLNHLYGDPMHPRGLGQALLADTLLAHLAAAERDMAAAITARADGVAGADGHAASNVSQDESAAIAAALRGVPAWRPPQQPLTGQFRASVMRCYLTQAPSAPIGQPSVALPGAGLPQLLKVASHSAAWAWTEYQTDGEHRKYKPGWVSKEAGYFIELELDTAFSCQLGACTEACTPGSPGCSASSSASSGASSSKGTSFVVVSYLASYQHQGKASLSCTGGCTCQEAVLNGHITQHYSVPAVAKVQASASAHCRVRLTILRETDSGEHKFKVLGAGVEGVATYR